MLSQKSSKLQLQATIRMYSCHGIKTILNQKKSNRFDRVNVQNSLETFKDLSCRGFAITRNAIHMVNTAKNNVSMHTLMN